MTKSSKETFSRSEEDFVDSLTGKLEFIDRPPNPEELARMFIDIMEIFRETRKRVLTAKLGLLTGKARLEISINLKARTSPKAKPYQEIQIRFATTPPMLNKTMVDKADNILVLTENGYLMMYPSQIGNRRTSRGGEPIVTSYSQNSALTIRHFFHRILQFADQLS